MSAWRITLATGISGTAELKAGKVVVQAAGVHDRLVLELHSRRRAAWHVPASLFFICCSTSCLLLLVPRLVNGHP